MARGSGFKRRTKQGILRANALLRRAGLEVRPVIELPTADFPPEWQATVERIESRTLVSPERTGGLLQAVEHVVRTGVPGGFVECGVWRGGSSMAMALTLLRLGELRELCLFDTYEGMPEPTKEDVSYLGVEEAAFWDPENRPTRATLEDVRAGMRSTGYPEERVRYIKGMVEDTVPEQAPDRIAVLRLDTDWYESTKHELEHLWPRLQPGGVLIVDDYGHYAGARKAVDEYFGPGVFLNRLDYTGRLLIKA